ncbi:MAG TPA: biotin--[acetyl-CoA-carboxylase] ligase [Myxococcales bacterium]|nr:biotin--[acetyl-CoA-carboxylase] ligase [Deltaproteobacteria bacterium]HAA55827.1 biotin--[acetyl-CoA-carboxylase] ligase [Myxococcales bacterium]|tara:strand:+ start:39414 stop:40190 length:777 start_codon:yes stop_codon:yes gene_type:complete
MSPTLQELQSVDSTNRYLREEVEWGRISQGAVWAREQTAGRGRRERDWSSPKGGLYLSVCTPVKDMLPPLFGVSVGLSAVQMCRMWTQDVGLKWPNDLLLRVEEEGLLVEKKYGGILASYVQAPNGEGHAVVGIGLNLRTPIDVELGAHAMRPGRLVDVVDDLPPIEEISKTLSQMIFKGFEKLLDQQRPIAQRQATLMHEWETYVWTVGKRVRVLLSGETLEGDVVGLSQMCELIVRDDAGVEHTVRAGDCVHMRAM